MPLLRNRDTGHFLTYYKQDWQLSLNFMADWAITLMSFKMLTRYITGFSICLREHTSAIQCCGIKYKWSYLLDTITQTLPVH